MAERSYAHRRTGALIALLLGLVALAGVVLVIARPARIIGVQEGSLARSIARKVEAPSPGVCVELDRGWRCTVDTTGRGPQERYLVDADDWGCWDARPVGAASAGGQSKESGCIWLDDHFGLFD